MRTETVGSKLETAKSMINGVLSLAAIVGIASCTHQSVPKKARSQDSVSISGMITNPQEESIMMFSMVSDHKGVTAAINSDGSFSGNFKMPKPGLLSINYGDHQHHFFVKSGYDLHLTWDGNKAGDQLPIKGIAFSGHGSEEVNFFNGVLYTSFKSVDELLEMDLSQEVFDKKVTEALAKLEIDAPKSDPEFTAFLEEHLDMTRTSFEEEYKAKQLGESLQGTPSPKFVDYENIDGSTTSLDDFKGKYVYIDFWATWCGPCIGEFPHLKKLEKNYHGKNIEFVSISTDEPKDKDAWKQMVKEKELPGVQLIVHKTGESSFEKGYKVDAIPRFVLIDPEGNIVSFNAPSPSETAAIKELFGQLDL